MGFASHYTPFGYCFLLFTKYLYEYTNIIAEIFIKTYFTARIPVAQTCNRTPQGSGAHSTRLVFNAVSLLRDPIRCECTRAR